jgi:CheY-like chemotaxis protein
MTEALERPLAGLSVLVAEDSWHLADAMRLAIERAGGSIVGPAGTLAEAERLARTARFDVAVMDLNLHGKLATGLAERLATAGTKVVVLTGYERPAQLASKVHACLTKPVSFDRLIAALAHPPSA